MVKGTAKGPKGLKISGSSLILECKNEELSDVQILHRKKLLEDLYILQGALQSQGTTQMDLPLGLNAGLMNGVPRATQISLKSDHSKQFITLGTKNGSLNGTAADIGNKKTTSTSSRPATPQQQSITQVLRATRKTTGSLPPPKINFKQMDNDDDIEVLEETKNNSTSKKQTQTNSTGSMYRGALPKAILPKSNHSNKSNMMLLNINIRPRNMAPLAVNSLKRKELDSKVKDVLMKTPSEFVEWLLRQGLIRSQQLCSTHKTFSRQPTKLKLGMFSDPKVLTSSGGYVWVGECCGRKYISVYSGSIFGSTPIDKVPPTSVLKLIYHWACQTSIANVETWVKVEKSFISKIYHYLKCICSVILHDKIYDFGFEGTPVELGIVSLGTTTADGTKKAVKVEILGLYDRQMKSYRLFASTPEPASNSRERFLRILKPVKEVVHKNARIICDQSVDPTCLHSMGYSNIAVCYSSENENDPKTNSIIMYCLRKHVPKMFQAALSQLSEHQVQLTLDELCWREKYGCTSTDCYDNMMENISYITYRELENPGVLPLLEFVAEFPHNNFRYKSQIGSRSLPSVPASVILAPTLAPVNVVPSQYNENKCLVMTNKVLTKNDAKDGDATNSIAIKNLTSLPASSFKYQTVMPVDVGLSLSNRTDKSGSPNAMLRNTDYKNMEPFFYGKIEGNPLMGQELNNLTFKCHLCAATYDDNIQFYSHIKFHLEGVVAEVEQLELMCPYCTTSFTTVHGLTKHKIDVHLMSDLTQIWCRICAEKFPTESHLKNHMMKKHVEAELPYRCEVCLFATSFYYEIINHFARSHRGAPYIQCHFCLSVKTMTPGGAASFSTRLFQHLQKHSNKICCRSCVLFFYSKYLLNEHRKEHLSCVNVNGLIRYESPSGYRVLQFRPNIRSMPIGATSQMTSLMPKNQVALSLTIADVTNLRLNLGEKETRFRCLECDQPIDTKMHFTQYRRCSRCSYFTCCQNMIMKHSQVFHPTGYNKRSLSYAIGPPIIMDEPMFCLCNFSTKSGHHMAKHLALCKLTTAYKNPGSRHTPTIAQILSTPEVEALEVEAELPMLPLTVEIEED